MYINHRICTIIYIIFTCYIAIVTSTSLLRHNKYNNKNHKQNNNNNKIRIGQKINNIISNNILLQIQKQNEVPDFKPDESNTWGAGHGYVLPNIPRKRNRKKFSIEDNIDLPAHQKPMNLEKLNVADFSKSDFGPVVAGQAEASMLGNYKDHERGSPFLGTKMKYRVGDPRVLKLP